MSIIDLPQAGGVVERAAPGRFSGCAAGADPHALPVTTDTLVGRDAELATLLRLLAEPESRLLTVTGPPGVGKTRLAIAAAEVAAPRFPDGVPFVDLTELRDPDLVFAAVLDAVGSAADDQPVDARAGPNKLLVVDNFEHVLDAGPPLAAAVGRFPGLRMLTTSRERLHLRAEREIPVPPLGLVPGGDDGDAPAVEMLAQCVRRFDPEFEVTPANHAALVEICTRLDGLPLALELAAARLKLFTPAELTLRLGHRMSILVETVRDAPRRHRTLRAALQWSHDLLPPAERAAFRRLSVFADGATLDGVGKVCDLTDPVGTVASLVEKNLLHRRIRPDGGAEFVMLHTLREYAREQLVEHGEEKAANARRARYIADRAPAAVEPAADDGAWPVRPPDAPRRLSAVPLDHARRHVAALTRRERQVARLIADGSTNRQIGRSLGIAEKTTESHIHNIIRKLGAQNRAEVAARVSAHETPVAAAT